MARTNKYTSLNFNDIYEKKINPSNNSNNTTSSSKSPSSSLSSSNKSYSLSASSRIHGNMLVLSRPSPKPQPPKQQHPLSQSPNQPHQTQPIRLIQQSQSVTQNKAYPPVTATPQPVSQAEAKTPVVVSTGGAKSALAGESISLRPKGNTGGSPSFLDRETKADGGSNNNNSNYYNTNSINNNNKFVPPHLRPGYVPKAVPEFQKPRQGNHRPVSAHGIFHGSPNRFVDDGRPKSGGGYDRRGMRGPGFGPGHGPGFGPNESDFVRPRSGGGSRPSSSG